MKPFCMIWVTLILFCTQLHSIRAQSNFTTPLTSVTQAEGLEAVFECLHPGAIAHAWAIDGTFQLDLPPDITSVNPSGGSPASLTIPAIPQYNNTVVQCRAIVDIGGDLEGVLSENETLLVQGPLLPVSNLQLNDSLSCTSLNISWDAPFSLSLTDVGLDIQYCIDVYDVTEGGDNLVDSICDIIDTFYLYDVHAERSCGRFNFTVTPRSNVPGAMNGTRSEPVQYSYAPSEIPIDLAQFITNAKLTPVKVIFPAKDIGSCPRRMPTNFSVRVQYIDELGEEPSCDCPTTFTMNNTVELTVHCNIDCPLERHRRCNMSIIGENRAGRTNSDMAMRISTHDVQKVDAKMSQQGQLDVSCTYLNGSNDPGFFTIVYSLANDTAITYRVAHRNGSEPITTLAIPNLQSSVYKLAVYDLNNDSIPEEKTAAQPDLIFDASQLPGTGSTNQHAPVSSLRDQPEVTTINGEICISCLFSDPEVTGCVGVIHSAQLDNLILTILPVERSVGMNCTNKTFKEGEYFVAVFGQLTNGLEEAPAYVTTVSVDSPPSTVTTVTPSATDSEAPPNSVLSGVLVTLAIGTAIAINIIIIIVVSLVWRNKKSKKIHISTEVDLQNYSLSDHSPGYESVTGILHTESTTAPSGGPPPPRYNDLPTVRRDPGYEDVERIQTWNRPVVVPSFSVTRDELISRPVSIAIDEDAPPLPPPCKPEDIISSSQVRLVQHGTGSVSTLPGVEESLCQSHQESHDLDKKEFVAQEPAYDVAKTVMVKQSTTSGPLLDDTVTEHQYSEVGGTLNEEGLHYSHVNVKPKPKDLPDTKVDPTTVVYSTVDEKKLVPRSEESEVQPEPAPPPPPRRPTADVVLFILDSIAMRWEDLGEALGIDDDTLDRFSGEGHPKVSLHDMIHYYFSSYQFKHTWEEIVQALEKIGEIETADKIMRTYKINVTESPTSNGPSLPPKATTDKQVPADKQAQPEQTQEENGGEHPDNAPERDTDVSVTVQGLSPVDKDPSQFNGTHQPSHDQCVPAHPAEESSVLSVGTFVQETDQGENSYKQELARSLGIGDKFGVKGNLSISNDQRKKAEDAFQKQMEKQQVAVPPNLPLVSFPFVGLECCETALRQDCSAERRALKSPVAVLGKCGPHSKLGRAAPVIAPLLVLVPYSGFKYRCDKGFDVPHVLNGDCGGSVTKYMYFQPKDTANLPVWHAPSYMLMVPTVAVPQHTLASYPYVGFKYLELLQFMCLYGGILHMIGSCLFFIYKWLIVCNNVQAITSAYVVVNT